MDNYRPWMQRYEIRCKTTTCFEHMYYVVDKHDDRFVKNHTFYHYKHEAIWAAGNYFRAEQRKIEKLLLG